MYCVLKFVCSSFTVPTLQYYYFVIILQDIISKYETIMCKSTFRKHNNKMFQTISRFVFFLPTYDFFRKMNCLNSF